jgi:dihydropteroate synthase
MSESSTHETPRAAKWQLRTRALTFSQLPLLMGIVNVTPDSFSDGGKHHETDLAVEAGLRLVDEGAAILDIGGESTRPYAEPVTLAEELARTTEVVRRLYQQVSVPVSIDTSKAAVARAALLAGAEIINDVTGLEGDAEMLAVALEYEAGICAMHMQGSPQTMQDDPKYANVVEEIYKYLAARRDALIGAGIDRRRICLDPGIGFGKTHEDNLTLLAHCHRYHALGQPLLVGHSRKGFIAKVIGDKQADRTPGTIGVSLSLALQGVQILRVHDVAAVHQAIELFAASGGFGRDK